MRWLLAVLVVAACYQPSGEASCTVRCGAGGACPGALTCDPASGMCAAGGTCGDAGPGRDAGQVCFATRMLGTFCFPDVVDTFAPTAIDTDGNCTTTVQRAGRPGDLCVLAARTIEIAGDVTATGSRGVVLLAHDLQISGTLDATAQPTGVAQQFVIAPGAGHCTAPMGMAVAAQAGTGGAGGSMEQRGGIGGGNGGNGNSTASDPGVADGMFLAGCAGGPGGKGYVGTMPGAGGAAGGAVYLSGTTIDITGSVLAFGLGGAGGDDSSGGGGGGSGGMIVIDGALTHGMDAGLLATGGGGGGGGDATNGSSGGSGFAPQVSDPGSAADGGTAGTSAGQGGDGGIGSGTIAGPGLQGAAGQGGGGGGGGGAGWILMYPTVVTGAAYPPAVLAPG